MSIKNFPISKYFWFSEVFSTSHIELLQQNQDECIEFLHDATTFARYLLDECRVFLGPMTPESWFRGPELNAKVGGSAGSGHKLGLAVDYTRWQTWDEVKFWGMGLAKHLKAEGKNFKIIMESKGGAYWLHIGKAPDQSLWTGIEGVYEKVDIA